MSTKTREKSPKEKLADVLARLPEMKLTVKMSPRAPLDVIAALTKCIALVEQFPAMLEQAKRKAFLEAEKICDGHGQQHGGTAQRIKREIQKLAEGKG